MIFIHRVVSIKSSFLHAFITRSDTRIVYLLIHVLGYNNFLQYNYSITVMYTIGLLIDLNILYNSMFCYIIWNLYDLCLTSLFRKYIKIFENTLIVDKQVMLVRVFGVEMSTSKKKKNNNDNNINNETILLLRCFSW